MKTPEIFGKIAVVGKRACFALRKNSPKILLGSGCVMIAAGAVKACMDTYRKLPLAIENAKQDAHYTRKIAADDKWEDKARNEAMAKLYLRSGWEIAKIYIPSVTMGTAGFVSILASHNIMSGRNAALASAYATLDSSFKKYRTRVLERYGEQAEMELRFGVNQKQIEETITDENGKKKKVKKTVAVLDDSCGWSDFARKFAPGHGTWENNSDYNDMFIRAQEAIAKQRLAANGILFLNEVYEMLGFDPTVAGQHVGWIYDRDAAAKNDGYVEFKTYKVNQENEYGELEEVIIIDFNVDGYILKRAEEMKLLEGV